MVSQTGSIAVGFDVKETSWDCDCDTNTFECSKENSVKGRTAIEAAVRFTLTPKCKCPSLCENLLWCMQLAQKEILTLLSLLSCWFPHVLCLFRSTLSFFAPHLRILDTVTGLTVSCIFF